MLPFRDLLTAMYLFKRLLLYVLWRTAMMAVLAGAVTLAVPGRTAAQDRDDLGDAVALFNQGQDMHEQGDLEGALALYQKALKILPEFAEAEYQSGISHLALNNNDKAETSLRRAIELRPDWTLAMTTLAGVLLDKGDTAGSERLLIKVLESEPQNPPALAVLADLRLRTKAVPSVLTQLLASISGLTAKANPTASLWTARAALEAALGQSAAARSSLSNALAIAPKNRNALLQMADLSLAQGDTILARDIAARLEAVGGSAEAYSVLKARIAAADGDLDGALKILDSITSPGVAATELKRRLVAMKTGDPADLVKELEAGSTDVTIPGRLCTMYRRNEPLRAMEFCRRASEAEPTNITHAVGYGAALVQAKHFEGAVTLLRKVLVIAPDNSTARANLATALFQLKRYPEARTEFAWLANAQPKNAAAYFFLGIIYDHLNEPIDAMAHYQEFLRLADPVINKLDIERVDLRLPALQKIVNAARKKKGATKP